MTSNKAPRQAGGVAGFRSDFGMFESRAPWYGKDPHRAKRTAALVLILAFFAALPARSEDVAAYTRVDPLRYAKEAVRSAPSFENYVHLGAAYAGFGRHTEALWAYQRASRINPGAPLANAGICAEENRLAAWKAAIEACERALAVEPEYARARALLARAKRGAQIAHRAGR